MKADDVESELSRLKLVHLTESELIAFSDQNLGPLHRARAEAHLKQCFICERLLKLLREEDAFSTQEITAEDQTLVERLWRESKSGPETVTTTGLGERLAESLRQMIASWRLAFQPVRHAEGGEEAWRWQSEDGQLRAVATIDENANMIVRFSSDEMELEGTPLRFRVGSFSQQITLERVSESEVAAQVAIPWQYRQGEMMSDISVETA